MTTPTTLRSAEDWFRLLSGASSIRYPSRVHFIRAIQANVFRAAAEMIDNEIAEPTYANLDTREAISKLRAKADELEKTQ